ncbi:class I SAM-dependent methyltransferase [Cryobacterium sp. BB307]|uniref:class I SAM-dependent methyltransferase n=1 Tax=Cryobacterium sp. BB307 TaxID=2716317 RepID=UPI0032BF3720
MTKQQPLSQSFGRASGSYERARPGYPEEAVAWLLDDSPKRVADIGAGTGKLTRQLVADGREVVAVDPDAEMLRSLHDAVPGVPTFVGSAERLPLPDASVDTALFAQAWHWVEPVAASAEVGRVVRPGGRLGLIWNVRDESVEWVRRFGEICHVSVAERMITNGDTIVHEPFGVLEEKTFHWAKPFSADGILDLARSRSFYIGADAANQERIDRELRELTDALPELADSGTIDLPYVTHAYRAVRL